MTRMLTVSSCVRQSNAAMRSVVTHRVANVIKVLRFRDLKVGRDDACMRASQGVGFAAAHVIKAKKKYRR